MSIGNWHEHFTGEVIESQEFTSKITGITYPYHIYLPASYATSPNQSFAIVYVLDGQWSFQGYAWEWRKINET